MDSPFAVLGISEKGINIDDAVSALTQQFEELSNLDNFYNEQFRKRFFAFRSNNAFVIRKSKENDIRDIYGERYFLELPLDKKYFSEQEFFDLVGIAQELEREAIALENQIRELNQQRTQEATEEARKLKAPAELYRTKSKVYNQSIREQASTIKEEKNNLAQLLAMYQENPEDLSLIAKIEDMYIKLKFEQALQKLFIQSPIPIKKNTLLIEVLRGNEGYRTLVAAYDKIATAEKREDLVAELYVTKRIANPIGAISEKEAKNITGAEREYYDKFVKSLLKTDKEREAEQATENQNHQYGWGIILTDPFYLLKDEPIDTPIFQGKITVENIGRFTEESLFRKVKVESELRRRQRRRTEIRGAKKDFAKKIKEVFSLGARGDSNEDQLESPKYMRDYYYSYRASKILYDEIYRVTKTDSQGVTRSQIVFSPVDQKSLGKDVSVDFLKNVYFSDYMLDLAQKNGGYAGDIYPAQNGGYNVYNYHPNCEEQIGAAILFDRGFSGSISDCRNGQKTEHLKVSKTDFLKLLSMKKERERSIDE